MRTILFVLCFLTLPILASAQCNISILNATTDTLFVPCGSNTVLERDTLGLYALNNDFNNGTIGLGWQATSSATLTNPCGAKSSTYLWLGSSATAPRNLATVPLDLSCGGTICFEFKMSIQGQAAPCEGPDQTNEGVTLEWSNGGVWNTIFYFQPNTAGSLNAAYPGAGDYTEWATYCYPIPTAAMQPNVTIRWMQYSSTTSQFDHWGLDSVTISTNCGAVDNLWSTGDTTRLTNTFTALQDSTYWVRRIVGANSATPDTCYDTIVISPQLPQINLQPAFAPFCIGTDAEIFINPANSQFIDTNYTYLYSWGPSALFDSTATNYALIENLNFDTAVNYQIMHPVYPQCSGTDTVPITVSGVQFDSIGTEIPECFRDVNQGKVFFSWFDELSPPITTLYRNGAWTNATIADSFVSLPNDTFTLVIQDVRCSDTIGFRVTTPDTVKPDTSNLILDICQTLEKAQVVGGINGTAPYDVYWDGNAVDPLSIKALSDTTVNLYIIDAKGCQSLTYPITFDVPDPLSIQRFDTALCPNNTIDLYASTTGGLGPAYYNYQWHNGQTDSLIVVSPRPGNSYGVTVSDGCVFPVSTTPIITIHPVPTDGLSVTEAICLGDSVIIEAPYNMASYRIVAEGVDVMEQPYSVVHPTQAGEYPVLMQIFTNQGCEKLDTTSFTVYEYPVADFTYDDSEEYQVRKNGVVDFENNSINNAKNAWFYRNELVSNEVDLSYDFLEPGRHFIELIVRNPLGCADSATQMVIVTPDQGLFIPNSFTPNNDNLNDTWKLIVPDHIDEFDLWVLDRWGSVVWESHDRNNNEWDGVDMRNGTRVPSGTYVYRLYVASPENELDYQEELHGTIQVF